CVLHSWLQFTGGNAELEAGPGRELFVLLVDHPDFALFVENRVEGFGFAKEDFAELFFLDDGDSLELDHFENCEDGDDHGVTRTARFDKADESDAGIVAGENLAAQLNDHLGDGERFVAQFDARDFFTAFENLLENLDEIDQRNNQFAFRALVVVKGFIRIGP